MRNFIVTLLSGLLLSQGAFAQEKSVAPSASPPVVKAAEPAADATATPPASPHFSPILPVKIHPRQGGADSISKAAADIEQENDVDADSIGLYARVSDGGMGGDIWKSYTSAKLAEDLGKINLNISSPTLRAVFVRALLTAPDDTSFVADAKTAKTHEAFSARMETLINLGNFTDTVALYKKLEGNIPSSKAAIAGVEGMIGQGQMGIACLEEKAIGDELKQASGTSFWPDLKSFCGILLTADTTQGDDDATTLSKTAKQFAAQKKLVAPASLNELNSKSMIEILAMDKAGLLPASLFTAESTKVLKPQIISFILAQSPADPAKKLSLLAAAITKGLKSPDDLATEYQLQSKTISPALGSWQAVLTSYGEIQAATETAKIPLLKTLLKTSESWSEAQLAPFAPQFGSIKAVDSFSPAEARKVLSLLIRSKTRVSGPWFAKAFDLPEAKTKESVTDLEVISALEAPQMAKDATPGSSTDDKKDEARKIDVKATEKPESIDKSQLHVLSLILQGEEVEDKAPEKSYEKLLSLTAPNDYVMPTMELTNGLKQASLSQDTGKVIVYSLQALNGQRISQIHPAALFRIMEGMQSVGLSEEIRSLAHEVLADLIEYKDMKEEK